MLRLHAVRPLDFIEPCQPATAVKPPIGPGWIHEIKHDGYRMMADARASAFGAADAKRP
jgi:ATP-dependent DNA ligase